MSMMMAYMKSKDVLPYECPICGLGLYEDDDVYIADGEILGCCFCFVDDDYEDGNFTRYNAEEVL